jgi:geranylgeranyl pyrophosphate synthase
LASAGSADIRHELTAWAERFEAYFDSVLSGDEATAPQLVEAMRYAALGGGKRLRPYLVVESCRACGGDEALARPVAAAVECVHVFSLVHDDLPAMDDDDLRRGRPTTHKVFGEALAILAGDALLALAFEVLVGRADPGLDRARLVRELAHATGWAGMSAGQVDDMLGEGAPPQVERVRAIHDRKTAALISAACRMGAIAAGADNNKMDALGRFGCHLGRAFQIIDDVLDETATAEELGKATTKDHEAGKQTYPAIVGIEASRHAATDEAEAAIKTLETFGSTADNLRKLVWFVLTRRS